jgi:hypothetical protein
LDKSEAPSVLRTGGATQHGGLAAAGVAAATAVAARDDVELVHGYSFLSYQGKWKMNRKFSIY